MKQVGYHYKEMKYLKKVRTDSATTENFNTKKG